MQRQLQCKKATLDNNNRVCSCCKNKKPVDAFGKDASREDGLNRRCKTCSIKNTEKWKTENPESYKTAYKKSSRAVKTRYKQSLNRAKESGKHWDIKFEDYEKLIKKNMCEYCGGELNETRVGLDRVDSSIGYTLDNVVPCCGRCNLIKGADLIKSKEMRPVLTLIKSLRSQKTYEQKEAEMIEALKAYHKEQEENELKAAKT